MRGDVKLGVCLALSAVVHVAIERGLERLPKYVDPPRPSPVTVRVIEPDPPKEPPPPALDAPVPVPVPVPVAVALPTPKPAALPISRRAPAPVMPVAPGTPGPDRPAIPPGPASSEGPVFGVNMESTSQQGGGGVPVGTTLAPAIGTPAANTRATSASPSAPGPIAAFEATKLPLPRGRCFGTYTDEARAAGLEGTVVLDLTVDEVGHARDISVVEGLGHGLGEAARRALIQCRFTPGEKDGKPVAVRIRGFKIEFVLNEH